MQDPRIGVKWRTPAAGAGIFNAAFSVPTPLAVIGLFGLSTTSLTLTLNISSVGPAGPWDIRSGIWTPDIDPDVGQAIWLNSRDLRADPAPVAAAINIRVEEGGVDVGRVWAGPWLWAPQANHTVGSSWGSEDLSTMQRTKRSGAVFADRAAQRRMADLTYDMVTDEERLSGVAPLMRAGRSNQVLFVPDWRVYPVESYAILGYQEQVAPLAAMTFDRWSHGVSLREAG